MFVWLTFFNNITQINIIYQLCFYVYSILSHLCISKTGIFDVINCNQIVTEQGRLEFSNDIGKEIEAET